VSTISDEIRQNSVKEQYDPQKAQYKARLRRVNASFRGKKIVANNELRVFVESHLLDGQSPEAISGRLRHQEQSLPYVSKDTIFRFLRSPYGQAISLKLKKKKRPKGRRKVTKLKDRVFIDKRPQIIEKRARIGDMEADFIVSGKSGKGVLLVATDRKIRVSFLEIIHHVSIDEVHSAFERIKDKFPEMRTATIDNDILFQMHKTLEKLLNIKIYFCHPYHSWEKGSIENVNKYVRKYIPKGSDLSKYDQEDILTIEKKTNQRFMKCLQYKTPEEKLKTYRKTKKQRIHAAKDKKKKKTRCSV
jgi:IS30 family transposase